MNIMAPDPIVPGMVRRERAVIYVKGQLDRLIATFDARQTKTVGENLWFRLIQFARDVRSLCRMSGDWPLLEQVEIVTQHIGERTPRRDAIVALRTLLDRLSVYVPLSDGDAISQLDDLRDHEPLPEGKDSKSSAVASLASEKSVFVIMPFAASFGDVWQGAIGQAAREEGFKAVRVDMINKSTNITDDIVESIRTAKVVIVDVTGNNPNVMFELGYAMALAKPSVIISQSAEYLPFDIRQIRTIVYENGWSGIELLRQKLREFLKATIPTSKVAGHPSQVVPDHARPRRLTRR